MVPHPPGGRKKTITTPIPSIYKVEFTYRDYRDIK
jgi:hypothetical protein